MARCIRNYRQHSYCTSTACLHACIMYVLCAKNKIAYRDNMNDAPGTFQTTLFTVNAFRHLIDSCLSQSSTDLSILTERRLLI